MTDKTDSSAGDASPGGIVPVGVPERLNPLDEQPPELPSDDGLARIGDAALKLLFSVIKVCILVALVGVTGWFSYVFGHTIYESYFKIPPEVTVPAISGTDVTHAYHMLQTEGLQLQVQESRYEKSVPKDVIVSQTPAPGHKVRVDRAILAVVSLGPELIPVPSLTGQSLRQAGITLSNHRLRLGKVRYTPPRAGQPQQIVHQTPAPGAKVRIGTVVSVKVQRDSDSVVVPAEYVPVTPSPSPSTSPSPSPSGGQNGSETP